jgi:hypothetical protein
MISRITAMMIASGDARPEACLNGDKYAGAVNLFKDGHYHARMLSTTPSYDTAEEALQDMQKIIDEVRQLGEEEGWIEKSKLSC